MIRLACYQGAKNERAPSERAKKLGRGIASRARQYNVSWVVVLRLGYQRSPL